MRIKLTMDIPVGREHGLTRGKILDATPIPEREHSRLLPRVTVKSEANETVALMFHEYEVVAEKTR